MNREKELENIKRFSDYKIMFYRDNVLRHSKRVVLLLKEVMPKIKKAIPNFNEKLSLVMAKVHDDPEMITGDITLYQKGKMNAIQLKEVEKNELIAIEKLSKIFPEKIDNINYKSALLHVHKKDCIEAQVVSYLDKLDGMCTSLHELHANNESFVEPVLIYSSIFVNFTNKFPELKLIVGTGHPLFVKWNPININKILEKGRLHDKNSIKKLSEIEQYDKWKEIIVKCSNLNDLITKVE